MEALSERLEGTARDAGYEGVIRVRGDEGMTGADVRLEWGAGAIQRSAEEIEARLDDMVARWLAAAPTEDDGEDSAPGNAAGASAA